MNLAVSSKLGSKYSGRRTKCIEGNRLRVLFIEFQGLLNPIPQLWVSGIKFLRGQATGPSCFATYVNAFSVTIAESFFQISLGNAHKEAAAVHSCLVCTSYEWQCRCHGPDQRNELATSHSIISSALWLSKEEIGKECKGYGAAVRLAISAEYPRWRR